MRSAHAKLPPSGTGSKAATTASSSSNSQGNGGVEDGSAPSSIVQADPDVTSMLGDTPNDSAHSTDDGSQHPIANNVNNTNENMNSHTGVAELESATQEAHVSPAPATEPVSGTSPTLADAPGNGDGKSIDEGANTSVCTPDVQGGNGIMLASQVPQHVADVFDPALVCILTLGAL